MSLQTNDDMANPVPNDTAMPPADRSSESIPTPTPVPVSVATQPADIDAVPHIVKSINESVDALSLGGDTARHQLLLKARSLVQALETPRETTIKHIWAQPGVMAAMQVGVDTGLWTLMVKNGDVPQKVTDLAASTGIDVPLLARLMRHLGAMGYLKETGTDEYMPTNFIKGVSLPIIGDSYLPLLAGGGASQLRFHEFCRKNGYRTPTSSANTGLMYAYNTDKDFFAWQQSIGYAEHFHNHMGGYRQGRLPWCHPSFTPVQERLIAGADNSPSSPFLVDVGGSLGHDLLQFQTYHPSHPGRLILQDLPSVLSSIPASSPLVTKSDNNDNSDNGNHNTPEKSVRIDLHPHDFFTPQPVCGARAYYLHSVLHDWPDADCLRILRHIRAAMRPGYSRVLINENVIPARDAWWEMTGLDMVMMTMLSARERTIGDWEVLMQDAGLRIVQVWSAEGGRGTESLIECEVAVEGRGMEEQQQKSGYKVPTRL